MKASVKAMNFHVALYYNIIVEISIRKETSRQTASRIENNPKTIICVKTQEITEAEQYLQ